MLLLYLKTVVQTSVQLVAGSYQPKEKHNLIACEIKAAGIRILSATKQILLKSFIFL